MNTDGSLVGKSIRIPNTSSGFDAFILKLKEINQDISHFEFRMESTGHYWLNIYTHLVDPGCTVHVIDPVQSDALRGLYIRQTKNDIKDSAIIADVIRIGRYCETSVSDDKMLSLRDLTRQHFYLVDMVSDLKRKSLTLIDRIFPEYPTLFSDTFGTNAENIYIQKQITKTAAQDIVKNTLEKIGIYALNRKNKKQIQNFDVKLNTHSLRKTFSDWFYNTGVLLKERGELNLDTEILKLLQEKFMHSSMSVTNRYNKVIEENFKIICQRMNIGLEALENI